MVLRPRCADGSDRSAHDRCRFSIPRAVPVGSRRPINRVLQHAWNRVVVFRRDDENGVRLAYPLLQLRDFCWRVLFLVLIETGYAVKLESFDGRAFRHEFDCRAQRGAVVRFTAKATGDAENTNWFTHVLSCDRKGLHCRSRLLAVAPPSWPLLQLMSSPAR